MLLATVAMLPSGCGGQFELPTERPNRIVPSDQSYAMLSTWKNMDGVQDLVITQGQGNQLFVLFNNGGSAGPSVPRGEVRLYPLTRPSPIGSPYFDPMRALFNPIAIAAGTNKLYVLDQGDSCLAKFDDQRGTCEADPTPATVNTQPRRSQVRDYLATWRIREYGLGGGDTLSTFTDTTIALPWGVAADEQGRVYVGGLAVVLDTLVTDQRIRTRKFVSRIYRYSRGQKYPGIDDVNMPGTSSWHRDTSWVVFDGTGASSVSDPRGLHWSRTGSNPLFVADRGNNQAKGVSSNEIGVSVVRTDGQATGSNLNQPEAIAADLAGFFYIVDRGGRRVLRYNLAGEYIQRVDQEPNADGLPLLDPVGIAVDDSLAYVADRGRKEIIRYRRRP
ncbi:MAG: hypothetical protein K8R56_05100 [Candidatus Eisenbacteria bacterium]|nr:hypothetical protein [Candidatus Eisenbacteria bacterium]